MTTKAEKAIPADVPMDQPEQSEGVRQSQEVTVVKQPPPGMVIPGLLIRASDPE